MSSEVFLPWLRCLLDAEATVFVGLDGRSGSGKSTLAATVVAELGAEVVTVIEGDQFYNGGTAETWDERSAEQKVADVIDWRRQRNVLVELRENGAASWYPFDWESEDWDSDDACLAKTAMRAIGAPLVILEGAYSCRPELHDMLDRLVLLDPPTAIRRARLLEREGDAYRSDWEQRWSAAEEKYFGDIMPAEHFDLVLGR